MAYADTWALRVAAANTTYFRAAATHGANAVFTLLQTNFVAAGALNGAGYRVSFTTSADITANATAWIIVGIEVGQTKEITSTETVTGPASATTVYSTKYWSRVDSITATGTNGGSSAAVTVAVGFGVGTVALPRCRIRGVHYVGTTNAGLIQVNLNGSSGTELLGIATPAGATAFAEYVRTNHILVGRSAAQSDYGLVTLTEITKCTLFLT